MSYRAVEENYVEITDKPYTLECGKVCPPGFYFWDELGLELYGPYDSLSACREARTKYALSLW